MSRIIDITPPMTVDMPVWPGERIPKIFRLRTMEEGDPSTVSAIDCNVHTGTHIDAPAHNVLGGATVEQIPLDTLVGPAYVAHVPGADVLRRENLEECGMPKGTKRLLVRTRNSELWRRGEKEFVDDFVALSNDAAKWVVEQGILLFGIDYLSVHHQKEGEDVHTILLKAGLVLLETINLAQVEAGRYELVCLPLNLPGCEGAPARAILRPL
jgi:arylformamidase